jgi:hypothetical protein
MVYTRHYFFRAFVVGEVDMTSAHFWGITRTAVVITYPRFGVTYRPQLQRS